MTLTVDGIEAPAEGALLDAVLAAGVALPHLCKDGNLPAIGACRTCLVEADGRIVAACSAPAAAYRVVVTTGAKVERIRRGVLELTEAMTRPECLDLPGGPHAGELAAALESQSARGGRYARRVRNASDSTNTFFSFHEDACILCGRCVAACQELQHIGAIGMAGRGRETRVTPGAGVTFAESICTSCGSCVAACPSPALRPRGAAAT
ncbi:MAG: (2Fe-2S)-binding protein [Dehalococcoidia bacterium]|nr:(2Fe-2S)-binding protein [Dehalococcoidia bacterium]